MKRIAIVGAGGFAREVAWLISEINQIDCQFEFLGYLAADAEHPAEHDSSNHVLGDFNWLDGNQRVDALAFGIGSPARKSKVIAEVESCFPHLEWPALIHPTIRFDRSSCKIERGAVLCAGSIGTVNVTFREFCMVNLLCTIGHEVQIGRLAVVNPTVSISGGVTIGDRVLVGTGAHILQYLNVGRDATVGAGAVVVQDVEPGTTVFGNPARLLLGK
jgi:sugar O-acyltransferase (sialic acid O-acetyltransferase NeuD family)